MRWLIETSYLAQRADQQQHKNNCFDPKLQLTALNHHKGLWGRRSGGWDDSVPWELVSRFSSALDIQDSRCSGDQGHQCQFLPCFNTSSALRSKQAQHEEDILPVSTVGHIPSPSGSGILSYSGTQDMLFFSPVP